MTQKCPVCDSELKAPVVGAGNRDASKFSCPRCGEVTLSRSLMISLTSSLSQPRQSKVFADVNLHMKGTNMANLKTRIEVLEKGSGSGAPLIIYDDGKPSGERTRAIAQAEASGRAVIRVSSIDEAL